MSVENFCHEKLTLSKDRIFSESVRNVKNGSPGGLAFVGAECGDPKMKYFLLKFAMGARSPENHPVKKPLSWAAFFNIGMSI